MSKKKKKRIRGYDSCIIRDESFQFLKSLFNNFDEKYESIRENVKCWQRDTLFERFETAEIISALAEFFDRHKRAIAMEIIMMNQSLYAIPVSRCEINLDED